MDNGVYVGMGLEGLYIIFLINPIKYKYIERK